jgi:hypothetical protein
MCTLRENFQMVTDAGFGYAADSQAKHQSQTNPAYFYIFGFRSSNLTSLIPEWMGEQPSDTRAGE